MIEHEGVSRVGLVYAFTMNAKIQTCSGNTRIRDHYKNYHLDMKCAFGGLAGVYRCEGCDKLTCACNGGAPDPRCDDCWFAAESAHIKNHPENEEQPR